MKDGYYWVRDSDGIMIIAELCCGVAYLTGIEIEFKMSDFYEIGDYIETPDKYK